MSGTTEPPAADHVMSERGPDGKEGLLTLGLLAGSTMENERRLPLHPRHLDRIDRDLRARMIVERGYAAEFQLEPGYVESRVGRVAERAEVIESADVLLLPSRKRPKWPQSLRAASCGDGPTACKMRR